LEKLHRKIEKFEKVDRGFFFLIIRNLL